MGDLLDVIGARFWHAVWGDHNNACDMAIAGPRIIRISCILALLIVSCIDIPEILFSLVSTSALVEATYKLEEGQIMC